MKKVLIGCGAVLGLGLIVALILGYFGYRKIQSMKAYVEKISAEQQALNRDFPWTGGSRPPRPDEARTREYLAVRKAALVPFRELTVEMDRLDEKKRSGDKLDLGEAIGAGRAMAVAMFTVLEVYHKNLREQRMSPEEFKALTRVLYPAPGDSAAAPSPPPPSPEMTALQQRLDGLTRRLNDPALPAAERADLTPQRDAAEIQMKALQNAGPSAAAAGVVPQDEIDALKDPRFDELIIEGKTDSRTSRRYESRS
jgi:hypothetical protein